MGKVSSKSIRLFIAIAVLCSFNIFAQAQPPPIMRKFYTLSLAEVTALSPTHSSAIHKGTFTEPRPLAATQTATVIRIVVAGSYLN